MFKISFKFHLEKLQKARDLYPKARQKFRDRIASIAIPKIQQDVQAFFAPYPGPSLNSITSSIPWEFATSLSRKWFFANFPDGYERTGELANGWFVYLITSFEGNASFLSQLVRGTPLAGDIQVVISNDYGDSLGRSGGFPNIPISYYVYGPRQVPGHTRTGWQINDSNQQVVISNARSYIVNEWGGSVRDALSE